MLSFVKITTKYADYEHCAHRIIDEDHQELFYNSHSMEHLIIKNIQLGETLID